MMEFIKTKKNYLIGLAVLFVFISLSGPTYSLFLKQESTSEFNYNTGILDLTFTEDKPITLDSAFPTIDSEGAKQKPYNLTIKNTGSLSHLFDLKMISTKEYGSIDYKYIKVKVNDYLPHTLASTENVIADNILLNPGEEITLNIRIWLDSDTPNNELGKSFAAKIISSGQATYKTLDNSGANHPTLADNMLPVYYDETTNNWRLADRSNNNNTALWYNYDNSVWANSVILNESTTYIFDELRNNDLEMSNIKVNNSNLIIDNKALDIKLSAYNYDAITQIMRIKFTELPNDYIYLISNGQISYYYDNNNQQFVFKNGGNTVTSSKVTLEKNTWHIIGYTYNGNKVVFYLDGTKINDAYITGSISKGESFKIATNNDNSKVSRMTIGDILTYHKVLSDNDFASNFKASMNPSKEGLVSAYREFTPMTLREYYQTRPLGTALNDSDINSMYVWIPRFKYLVWNVTGGTTDSYNAYKNGINIIFENGTTESGLINCTNNGCFTDKNGTIKVTDTDNGKYYTHPAFNTNTGSLRGFWVSKYEVSTPDKDCVNDIAKCKSNSLAITVKKGGNVWRGNTLANYYSAILKVNNNTNYRVIKNTEWGAISYLAHSKYGVCKNSACAEIEANKTYVSGNNPKDSTTGSMYGVFDMAGSTSEYTMSNYSETNTVNLNGTSFGDSPIGNDDYNLYTKDSFILGDATKELTQTSGIWYGNTVNTFNGTNNWLIRGGNVTENYKGLYAYGGTPDNASEYLSTRIVIK